MADASPDAAELAVVVGLAFALAVVAAVGPALAGPTAALDGGSASEATAAGATPIGDGTTVTEPGRYVSTPNVSDGENETTGVPTTDSGPVSVTRQAGVEIRFTCENVRVSVPEGTTYSLVVHYHVPETGEYGRTLVGPFEGTVEEPFDAEIVFFEVGVLVGRSVVASGYIPEECPNAPGITLVGDKS